MNYIFNISRFTNVELGLAVDSHDEVLESNESDFRALPADDDQRFQRLSEDYAVWPNIKTSNVPTGFKFIYFFVDRVFDFLYIV